MAWMSLSPLTPVALTTHHFLRWCSDSRWTTGSTTPSAAWWGSLTSTGCLTWSFTVVPTHPAVFSLPPRAGMVQPRTGVCPGRVLCQERGSRLSQTSVLPARSAGKRGEWGNHWPHPASLQLRFLCLPRPWEQVCPPPFSPPPTFNLSTVNTIEQKRQNRTWNKQSWFTVYKGNKTKVWFWLTVLEKKSKQIYVFNKI